jgi:hypothetical protein
MDSIETKIKRKMDIIYNKLNQKLNMLITYTTTTRKRTKENKHNTHARVINLSNTTFNHEHTHTLSLRPNFAIEEEPKLYINNLIIDTENAIRHLDPKIQNTFRYMAADKLNKSSQPIEPKPCIKDINTTLTK